MNERKLDNLISGLTGVNPPVRTEPVDSADNAQDIEHKGADPGDDGQEERFCSILPSVLLRKVRIIARREGLSIKQVMAAAVRKAVTSYEQKHGPIDDRRRNDTSDLF
jgi:hypothetical protein